MASGIKIPVNLPYYWKVVLKIASGESGFVDAGNNLLNDLFFDIFSFYQNCDIMTSQVFRKFNHRIMKIQYFLSSDNQNITITDDLYGAGFCVDDTTAGFKLKLNTGTKKIASLADSFYMPQFIISEGTEYTTDSDGVTRFHTNIFVDDVTQPSVITPWQFENYITPSGLLVRVRTAYLLATDVSMKDSPLYNNYGALVYDREIIDSETEFEYRNKILGLFYLMYSGMTYSALNAAVNVMCGYPVTLHNNETVMDIDTTHNLIKTEYRDVSGSLHTEEYTLIPSMPLADTIKVGYMYAKFTPLYGVITVQDSNTDPDWAHDQVLPEELYKTDYTAHKKIDLTTTLPLVYQDSVSLDPVTGDPYIRYDTPGMVPFNVGGTLSVYTWTYYIWNHFLKNALCKITITTDTSAKNMTDVLSMEFLDSVLPIWLYYIVDQVVMHVDDIDTQTEDSPGYIEDSIEVTSV